MTTMSAWPSLSTSAITGYSMRVPVVLQARRGRCRWALVDAEAVLVGVDDLGLAVAVEVEDGAAGEAEEQSWSA
jgi:hypothetical protein